ncbi:hypothetical protein OKW21_004696 [Catalinimonas alkaloidigena]|nr:hypothetical protein [Catalinimonas alkaloidigena]
MIIFSLNQWEALRPFGKHLKYSIQKKEVSFWDTSFVNLFVLTIYSFSTHKSKVIAPTEGEGPPAAIELPFSVTIE